MSSDRREFLGTMFAAIPAAHLAAAGAARTQGQAAGWDVSWATRVTSRRHRAVFDSPEIGMGLALARTLVWFANYQEVYGTPTADLGAVVVLRHNGIWIAMDDAFWARYKVGELLKITDPATGNPILRNPFLGANIYPDLPPAIMDQVLQKVVKEAVAVLACNLAFQDAVLWVKQHDRVDDAAARETALRHLVPGVVLQPSGVFAVLRAQEAMCHYLLAS